MSSKCIICFTNHDLLWEDGSPARYCAECEVIKKDSVPVISPIIDNLFLSSMTAASTFDGIRLCVHENIPTYTGTYYHYPILIKKPNNDIDRSGALAPLELLNNAVDIIEMYIDNDLPILVHCVGGVERSPLTVAWYLIRSGKCKNFEEAYTFLKSKRPVVSERVFWLPKELYDKYN